MDKQKNKSTNIWWIILLGISGTLLLENSMGHVKLGNTDNAPWKYLSPSTP